MATNSLNDLSQLINQQTELQELLGENLTKAKILLDVALECDLLQHPFTELYHYFWAISDFLEKSTDIHEMLLNGLVKEQRLRVQGAIPDKNS